MDPFQYFPIELVEEILSYVEGYSPVLRGVSSTWRNIINFRKRKAYSIKSFAKHGDISPIRWIHRVRPLTSRFLNQGMAYAARGGHKDLVLLFKEWGATKFDWGMAYAAGEGHKDLVLLFKEWGATNFNWAMTYAAEGGHKDLVLLFKKWGATNFNRGMADAAE